MERAILNWEANSTDTQTSYQAVLVLELPPPYTQFQEIKFSPHLIFVKFNQYFSVKQKHHVPKIFSES